MYLFIYSLRSFDDRAWLGDSVAGPAGAGHDQAATYRQVGLPLIYIYLFIYLFTRVPGAIYMDV